MPYNSFIMIDSNKNECDKLIGDDKMGTWGTGIYSNDTAGDVRDMCKEIYPFVSVGRGNEIIFEEFREVIESDILDDDYASFWYALADWQWKHGILSEEIKQKTISLLTNHTSIEDWEEMGDCKDVNKRIEVMDKLKRRLESPQPGCKLSPAKLAKPKHKAGDIIIFRSCTLEEDEYDNIWRVETLSAPFMFKNSTIANSSVDVIPVFDMHDKYMAVLCIGTEKEQYSKYLPDLYNEHSIYVHYDYISKHKPTVDELKRCGFLPQVCHSLKDFNRNITDYIGWRYAFLVTESFRVTKTSAVREFIRENCKDEVDRFYQLFRKNHI